MSNRIKFDTGFAPVPYAAMRDERLSIEARGLLAMLMTHAERWTFKRADIIEKCKCGEAKYERMIRELKAVGYLSIDRVPDPKNDGKLRWQWTIMDASKSPIETKGTPENQGIVPPENRGVGTPRKSGYHKDKQIKDKQNSIGETPKTSFVFEEMWKDINPKLVQTRRGGKDKSRKAFFAKAKKHGAVQLANALRGFYRHPDVAKDNCKYAPAIIVALNGDKFEPFLGATEKKYQSPTSSKFSAMAEART